MQRMKEGGQSAGGGCVMLVQVRGAHHCVSLWQSEHCQSVSNSRRRQAESGCFSRLTLQASSAALTALTARRTARCSTRGWGRVTRLPVMWSLCMNSDVGAGDRGPLGWAAEPQPRRAYLGLSAPVAQVQGSGHGSCFVALGGYVTKRKSECSLKLADTDCRCSC